MYVNLSQFDHVADEGVLTEALKPTFRCSSGTAAYGIANSNGVLLDDYRMITLPYTTFAFKCSFLAFGLDKIRPGASCWCRKVKSR